MWGSSFGVFTAVVVAGLLLVVAALTAWTPLFAVGIAAVAIAGFALYHGIKGGREETATQKSEADRGAPAATDEPEHMPRKGRPSDAHGGIWGEKQEA